MTETNLKAVLTLDEQTSTYTPVAHNLSTERAEAKANELTGRGVKAQILPQAGRHKGRNLKTCELCKNASQNLSQKPIEGTTEEEHTGEF
ncbi:MAG TPA: hypothetical protein VKY85_14475 [Candidatus Angelobacter sp.]|nr:hypothetical protein [Candidatus Angelobacter sp.]